MNEEDYSQEEFQPYSFDSKQHSAPSEQVGIIRELNPSRFIEDERHFMRGELYNGEKGKYEKISNFTPLMNDLGFSKYISILVTPVTSLVTFGNYTQKEVNDLTRYFCANIIPLLFIYYKEFGILKENLPIITSHIFMWTFASLKKGFGGGDRGVISRSISENIVRHFNRPEDTPKSEEKKGWGFLKK